MSAVMSVVHFQLNESIAIAVATHPRWWQRRRQRTTSTTTKERGEEMAESVVILRVESTSSVEHGRRWWRNASHPLRGFVVVATGVRLPLSLLGKTRDRRSPKRGFSLLSLFSLALSTHRIERRDNGERGGCQKSTAK